MESRREQIHTCEICGANHPTESHVPQRTIVQETPYQEIADKAFIEKIMAKSEVEAEKLEGPFVKLDLSAEGYGQIIVKDESENPTGTHKDQLALELAKSFVRGARLAYQILHEEGDSIPLTSGEKTREPQIQRLSLITSGHGGIALAKRFKKHDLPQPKLLLDTHTDPQVIDELKAQGADIYLTDLTQTQLTREDILKLTNNPEGSDLTSDSAFGTSWVKFYRTLAKEIIRKKPSQIYVPYGSGNLFEGLVYSVYGNEIKPKIFGAEPETPDTKAVMLYAPSKPFKFFGHIEKRPKYAQVLKVNEEEIETAHELYKKRGIAAGYSSAAGLGLYMKNFREGKVSKKDKVIIVNTGRGIVKQDW